jgi:uncharacterized membrane protein
MVVQVGGVSRLRARRRPRELGLLVVVALALLTGWLGGELVSRLGVGVDDNAELNAPSSLTHTVAHRNVM